MVGVPKTLIISTNWSTPLSPGNIGWPNKSSAKTHPADQTSEKIQKSIVIKQRMHQNKVKLLLDKIQVRNIAKMGGELWQLTSLQKKF